MRLLDTDTCIAILRGDADVVERRAATPDEVATTWITAAELHCIPGVTVEDSIRPR